jgi:hypothetical protein
MAKIRVTCPACRTELELDAAHEGQEVECGNCLEVFKANPPGAGGGPRIPAAAPRSTGGGSRRNDRDDDDRDADRGQSRSGGGGSSRGRPSRPPARRRRDDDDDYERDRRRDDDFDDYDPRPYRGDADGDGPATAALVLGIISVVFCCCWAIAAPVGLIACICGGLGVKSRHNSGQAIAGIVLGVIGMGLSVLFFLIFLGMGR